MAPFARSLRTQKQGGGREEPPVVVKTQRAGGPRMNVPGEGKVARAPGVLQGDRESRSAANFATPMARYGGPAIE